MNERINSTTPDFAMQLHLARYNYAAKMASGKKVLDIACGPGYGSKMLLDAGATQVIGMDIDNKTINQAQSDYPESGLTFKVGNAEAIELDDASIDMVVSFETIEHLNHPGKFLDEVMRILKPGGKLILSTPNRNITSPLPLFKPGNVFHEHEFKKSELISLIKKSGFKDIQYLGQQSIQKKNLKKFLITQSITQVIRTWGLRKIVNWAKSSSQMEGNHKKFIGDLHHTPDPNLVAVRQADELSFVRYMVVTATK